MVGSNTIHCARADTVMPSVTSASAMNFFMVCLSLCCRCRRQHAANHEKGFTTERRKCGVSGAQDSKKSDERNANGQRAFRTLPQTGLAMARRKPYQTRHAQQWAFRETEFLPFRPRQKNYFKIAIDNSDLVVHIHIKMTKEMD